MLLLFLSLFFHYDLFHCDVFEKADSNGPRTQLEHEATSDNFVHSSITDIMWNSTLGVDQMHRITPHYSFLPTPISHDTYAQGPKRQTPKRPYVNERFPQANRRNQKITQRKISNRQLKNNAFINQQQPQPHQGFTVLEISKRRNPGSEPKALSYHPVRRSREHALHRTERSQILSTGTKKKLFPNLLLSNGKAIISDDDANTDDDDDIKKTISQIDEREEILRMREILKITKKFWYSDHTKVESDETETTTTAQQFLRYITVAHSYFEMIETLQEGYMIVFLIELTRLIATKERKAVRDVVKHTDQIIHGLYQSGQLLWFGEPLINVTRKVARLLMESKIDVIQNHAANLHHKLSQRHQRLSEEVNTILEFADMLYDDDEGRILFDTLKEFAAYPNIRFTGYWLCSSVINNFLRPYRRLKDTQQRRELMDSINLELKSYNKIPLRSGDVRQADDPPDENQPSPQSEPVTQTEIPSGPTRSPREIKMKRHHQSHKRKRERKRHRVHRYRPEYSERYSQKHILGSMTQRTSVQSRFRVKNQ